MPARLFPLLVALALLVGGSLAPAASTQYEVTEDPDTYLEPGTTIEQPSPRSLATQPEQQRLSASEGSGSSERVNPWGTTELHVAITTQEGAVTDAQREAVAGAVDYWNQNADAYGEYEVTFTVDQDEPDPEVIVSFVSGIDRCGPNEHDAIVLACGPQYDEGSKADVPATIRVRDGRSADALTTSVKHEFGHLLGLDHGEGPMPLMAERHSMEPRESVLDATDRFNPWHRSTLTVAVVQDGSYDQQALRSHAKEAMRFYERGPPGWDGPTPEFRLVRDPQRADITLRVTHADACEMGGGYCWTVSGEQLDDDPALEYYTGFEVTFGDLESRYLSWYTGRALGYALGAENESELPDTFRDPQGVDERWFDYESAYRQDGEGTGTEAEQPEAR